MPEFYTDTTIVVLGGPENRDLIKDGTLLQQRLAGKFDKLAATEQGRNSLSILRYRTATHLVQPPNVVDLSGLGNFSRLYLIAHGAEDQFHIWRNDVDVVRWLIDSCGLRAVKRIVTTACFLGWQNGDEDVSYAQGLHAALASHTTHPVRCELAAYGAEIMFNNFSDPGKRHYLPGDQFHAETEGAVVASVGNPARDQKYIWTWHRDLHGWHQFLKKTVTRSMIINPESNSEEDEDDLSS